MACSLKLLKQYNIGSSHCWKDTVHLQGICRKLAKSGLPEIEILVSKEGSEDLNMYNLAIVVIFRYFNDVTTEGRENLELL